MAEIMKKTKTTKILAAFVSAIAIIGAAVSGNVAAAGPALADPAAPCGTPDVPCAGPSPLTPEQQCALIAWRTWTPCNWAPGINMQVPEGTPGSWG
jgi:hypothetical protein